MGNEDHSWALLRYHAVCGCVKCYQLISFFWMCGMQSVLGHPSQLEPVCHLYWVGRNLLPPENNDFWFLSLLCWAKWGFVCYLDGNSASFHYYLSRGIKINLLYNRMIESKKPYCVICFNTVFMDFDNEIHILWFYNKKQQEYLFSSRAF